MNRKKRLLAGMANFEWRPLALGPFALLVDETPTVPEDLADVRRRRAYEMYVEGLRAIDRDGSAADRCAG